MKTACQEKATISAPPDTGPMPTPMPPIATHIAMALARSAPVNRSLTVESVQGRNMAPPAPMAARATINWTALSERTAPKEAAAKTASPRRIILARPKRSPRLPIVSRSPAKERIWAAAIHWSMEALASNSRWSVGSDTARSVLSIPAITGLRESAPSAHQRSGRPRSCSALRAVSLNTRSLPASRSGRYAPPSRSTLRTWGQARSRCASSRSSSRLSA